MGRHYKFGKPNKADFVIFLFTFNHKLIQKSRMVSMTILEIPILDAGMDNKISVGQICPSSMVGVI